MQNEQRMHLPVGTRVGDSDGLIDSVGDAVGIWTEVTRGRTSLSRPEMSCADSQSTVPVLIMQSIDMINVELSSPLVLISSDSSWSVSM